MGYSEVRNVGCTLARTPEGLQVYLESGEGCKCRQFLGKLEDVGRLSRGEGY